MANTWFNKEAYLINKLAAWQKEAGNASKTMADLEAALATAGMTAEQHYELFGADEGVGPNEYFDEAQYLANQVAYLNQRDSVTTWTADSVKAAIKAAGMTTWSHFQSYGWDEGVNPSSKFDINGYFAAKLEELKKTDAATWGSKTVADVKAAFKEAAIDPVSHYFAFGKTEGVTPVAASSSLTEALATLKSATAAERASLEKAAEHKAVEAELEAAGLEVSDATVDELQTALTDALGDAVTAVNTTKSTYSTTDFATASAAVREAVIAEATAGHSTAVSEAKAAADKVGVLTQLDKANKAAEVVTAALNAEDKAELAANAEFAKFKALNSATVTETTFDAGTVYSTTAGKVVINPAYKDLDGVAALLATIQSFENAQTASTTAQQSFETALKAVLKAESTTAAYDAALVGTEATKTTLVLAGDVVVGEEFTVTIADVDYTFTAATTSLADVITGLKNAIGANASIVSGNLVIADAANADVVFDTDSADVIEDDKFDDSVAPTSFIDDYYAIVAENKVELNLNDSTPGMLNTPKADAYAVALAAQKAFSEAVSAYNELAALDADATAKTTALQEATDWFEDNGYELPVVLEASSVTATAEGDIYVLGTTDTTIGGFGSAGDDVIFFGDTKYTVTKLADDADLAKAVGDAAVLEVFVVQTAAGTVVAFEKEAFSGSATGTTDLYEITLTGVAAENVVIGTDGYVTVAAA